MRRHPFRVTRLGAVLTIAVGLLTPMAANMVGAQAGLPVVIAQETPVVTVSPVRPRGFHPPSSGVRPNPERIARQAAIEVRWTNVLVHVRGTTAAYARPSGRAAGGRGAGRLEVLRLPDRGLGRGGLGRRSMGAGGASLHVAAARGWIRLAGLSRGPRGSASRSTSPDT